MLNFGLQPMSRARDAATALANSNQVINLVPFPTDATQWNYLFATWSGPLGLEAATGYPGYEIASGGAYFHRATFLRRMSLANDTFAVSLLVREGSSGKIRLWARNLTTAAENSIAGDVSTLSGSSGSFAVTENTLLPDGLTRRIVATLTQADDGEMEFNVGPFSAVVGDSVIIIGAQVEEGLTAHAFTP